MSADVSGTGLLEILLADRTAGRNILWAASGYEEYGKEYSPERPVEIRQITGENSGLIRPRFSKEKTGRRKRTKARAEVFTPAWMCNLQNNLIDAAWLGRENVFNTAGFKDWKVTSGPVEFPEREGRRWTDYVDARRLEPACGEAPYLAARYDAVTGKPVPLCKRAGLLDRKMRIAGENTQTYGEWMRWAKRAFESVYGYEYQGDSLLLARENLLCTFAGFYAARFGREPSPEELLPFARIVSWNIWQMDGLTGAPPFSDPDGSSLCRIRNWRTGETFTFAPLPENGGEGKMEFDAAAGNPPYQEADGGASASARPLYPHFVNGAGNPGASFSALLIPARWYAGGKGLGAFRRSVLEDACIRELHDFLHPEEIFPGASNRGGLCCLLRDRSYDNTSAGVKVVTHEGAGRTCSSVRPLKTPGTDIFVRNSKAAGILEKVLSGASDTMDGHISPRRPFGLDGAFVKTEGLRPSKEGLEDPVLCFGRGGASGYLERASVPSHPGQAGCRKVFLPYANNIGTELADDNQNAFPAGPDTVCTETFLAAGMEDGLGEEECLNLCAYLKTKFARFLLGLAKTSQHGTRKTYRFVPVVDFKEEWTDEKLYARFGLGEEEIRLIENSIRPMPDG